MHVVEYESRQRSCGSGWASAVSCDWSQKCLVAAWAQQAVRGWATGSRPAGRRGADPLAALWARTATPYPTQAEACSREKCENTSADVNETLIPVLQCFKRFKNWMSQTDQTNTTLRPLHSVTCSRLNSIHLILLH